jgi:cysteine desulfurase
MFPRVKPAKHTIYLDHAATTYLRPEVVKAMKPFEHDKFGNPSSLYKKGREGSDAIQEARRNTAEILCCKPSEIIFTAGGTESVNLAIFGIARAYELATKQKGHIISSTIEHHAVLRSLEALAEEGWQITLVNVDKEGFVNMSELQKAVRKNTVLISIMYANNEIGTIEPINSIGKWLSGFNKDRQRKKMPKIYFHTDACQAAGSLELDVNHLGVDLLSLNGSKVYGPKQTGLLYVKSGSRIRPLIFGGGQEKGLRSGTENVAGIVGMAAALQSAQKERIKENKRLRLLRNYLIDQLFKKIPNISLNGPSELGVVINDSREKIKTTRTRKVSAPLRLTNNVNVSLDGIEGETLMLYLDSYNVAVSTGSACTSTSNDPSHVILALGYSKARALSSIRFSLGKKTNKTDIDYVLKVLPPVIEQLRNL